MASALQNIPEYRLICTGHSLGADVAELATRQLEALREQSHLAHPGTLRGQQSKLSLSHLWEVAIMLREGDTGAVSIPKSWGSSADPEARGMETRC